MTRLLRPCLGVDGRRCPTRALTTTSRCDACERRRRDGWNAADAVRRGTPTQRGYGWPWPRIRRQVLEEERACRSCGRSDVPLQVDHVVIPAGAEGSMERSNLQVLCRACHARKTHAGGWQR